MSNTNKDLDQQVEKLETLAEGNTVISVAGVNFTPAKLIVAGGIISSVIGGLYGAFEVYKDYMDMKQAIQNYTAPDFSEYEKRIIVLEQNSEKGLEYTREINTNLKGDIRRIEQVVDQVERTAKTSQREVEKDINAIRQQVDLETKDVRRSVDQNVREMQKQVDTTVQNVNERVNRIDRETNQELRAIRREVEEKIKKALDNPLAN
jgi:BMFP domain-containing protein YqiC